MPKKKLKKTRIKAEKDIKFILNNKVFIRITPKGDFIARDKKVVNDVEMYTIMKAFFYGALRNQHVGTQQILDIDIAACPTCGGIIEFRDESYSKDKPCSLCGNRPLQQILNVEDKLTILLYNSITKKIVEGTYDQFDTDKR